MQQIKGYLIHLGSSMWAERYEQMQCEDAEWRLLTDRIAASGCNLLLIDLGEGVRYESHPEIAAKDAWSVEKLRAELKRLRGLGLEPIPKLNFSTAHDAWLGDYERQVSTPEYYRVCEDLIRETARLFDTPRFFHFGFDEEDLWCQTGFEYTTIRNGELWWHDLEWLVKTIEKAGMRPWMWSDFIWEHRDEFLKRMPRSVLQSNWYYDDLFDSRAFRWPRVMNYLDLDRAGFDQVPTCSNFVCDANVKGTVDFCRKNLTPDRVLGFLQTPWRRTVAKSRQKHLEAIDLFRAALAGGK